MQTSRKLQRLGGTVAVMAASVAGIGVLATPAGAATVPTATVQLGVVTVAGTDARDVIHVTIDTNGLTVDFGFDGTVDAAFQRSEFRALEVLAAGGNDGV